MAARSLAMPMWEAGQRMMRASSPDAFANIAAGDRIITANREALEACRKRANQTRKAVRCTVNVDTDAPSQPGASKQSWGRRKKVEPLPARHHARGRMAIESRCTARLGGVASVRQITAPA
ncbi:DUF6118 family protein [Sphingomonas sp. UYP23]